MLGGGSTLNPQIFIYVHVVCESFTARFFRTKTNRNACYRVCVNKTLERCKTV